MMRLNHIFYLLVILLSYWFSFPILGKPENNANCDGLFSSEQCEFITSLKSEIEKLKNSALDREIDQLKKQNEINEDIRNDIRAELVNELNYRLFNISKRSERKLQLPKVGICKLTIKDKITDFIEGEYYICLLYTSPSPRDRTRSRMPSSA